MNRSRYPLLVLAPYLGRYRGRLLVGSFMVLLTVIAGMCAPWALKYVVDGLQQSVDGSRLFSYALLIVAISLVEGFFRFWMRRILIGVSRQVEYDLRNDFLAHVQKMSLSFLQSRSTGDIMSRATNDLGAVRMVLGPGIMYSMNTVTLLVISTAILVNLNWKLTLLAYVPLALVSISVKQFGRRIHDRFEEIQEQFSALSTRTQENIAGIRVVKAFARENSEIRAFGILNLEYVRRNVSLIRLWGVFYPLMTALIGLSSVALLWFGGRQVIQGRLTLGEFVAFMGYLSLLAWPTIAIGRVINIFQRGSASMRRILEILETPPGIRDLEGAEEPPDAGGALEIRNLTFSYPSSPRPALSDVSLGSTGEDARDRGPHRERQIDARKPHPPPVRSAPRNRVRRRPGRARVAASQPAAADRVRTPGNLSLFRYHRGKHRFRAGVESRGGGYPLRRPGFPGRRRHRVLHPGDADLRRRTRGHPFRGAEAADGHQQGRDRFPRHTHFRRFPLERRHLHGGKDPP